MLALDRASVDLFQGEFVSIVGQSGCGKSTLLKILAGLLRPTSGTVAVSGEEITAPRADLGFMAQSATLLPWRSVMRNILLPLEIRRHAYNEAVVMTKANELIEATDLSSFRESYPRELSGGMQQRVALVRTLAYEPSILLMDEPFGSLDELTREAMNVELLRLWHGSQITVLFVTHNIAEAVFLSDRVIVMSPRPGTIVEDIRIHLERPRDYSAMGSESFISYVQKVRLAIQTKGLSRV